MPTPPALLRAVVVWLLIVAAESVHGALRRMLFDPHLEFVVRQVSVLTGALIIFAITWACLGWLRIRSAAGALGLGVMWVGLTLAFEIGLGRATGLSWARITSDYDLFHGGLMPLGLLAMALTPWAVRRLKARRQRDRIHRVAPATTAGKGRKGVSRGRPGS